MELDEQPPTDKGGGKKMNKKNLNIALKAVMGAQDIIGLVALPGGKYGYENFNDEQLRDIYYKLNEICCNLINRMEKSENIKEEK